MKRYHCNSFVADRQKIQTAHILPLVKFFLWLYHLCYCYRPPIYQFLTHIGLYCISFSPHIFPQSQYPIRWVQPSSSNDFRDSQWYQGLNIKQTIGGLRNYSHEPSSGHLADMIEFSHLKSVLAYALSALKKLRILFKS